MSLSLSDSDCFRYSGNSHSSTGALLWPCKRRFLKHKVNEMFQTAGPAPFCLVRVVRSAFGVVSWNDEPSDGEWDRIRAAIYRALRPFDEARVAVHNALVALFQAPDDVPC